MKITTSLLFLIVILFVSVSRAETSTPKNAAMQSTPAKAGQTATQNRSPNIPWEAGVFSFEHETLSAMFNFVEKKKWDEAAYHHRIYKTLGSNESAKIEIGTLLLDRNKKGALAAIRLTKKELIDPHRGPISSTRQVKKVFIRTIQSAEKWSVKAAIMDTMLNIFSMGKMTPPEMTAMGELQKAIEEELRVTSTSLGTVLLSILEHGLINQTPLDLRPKP